MGVERWDEEAGMRQRRGVYSGWMIGGLLLMLLGLGGPFGAGTATAAPAAAPQLRGGFAAFWEAHDGALLFGQPLTDEIVTSRLTVQWFEHARLEWHLDWPPGQQITLGRLGAEALGDTTFPG